MTRKGLGILFLYFKPVIIVLAVVELLAEC
jgi:hypothetical protein